MVKKSIFNFTLAELENILITLNLKKFVAKQIFNWIYKQNIFDFLLMNNLAKSTKIILKKNFTIDLPKIIEIQNDKNNETFKFLIELEDKNHIETVAMKFKYGYSICLSSQVGCNIQCKFCMSGIKKKIRDLQPKEIIGQYMIVNDYIMKKFQSKINNIVVMGIGEPFDNFSNLIIALNIFIDHFGLMIGQKHITVSTCGLCPKIIDFAKLMPKINLAISLHAPNDEIRNKIMPINHIYDLKKLINVCKQYLDLTKQRITFEYILLDNVNDSNECALQLVSLIKNLNCYVNLIPYNETNLNNFSQSKKIKNFFNILSKNKITTIIRAERGREINAACGQLRINYEANKNIN